MIYINAHNSKCKYTDCCTDKTSRNKCDNCANNNNNKKSYYKPIENMAYNTNTWVNPSFNTDKPESYVEPFEYYILREHAKLDLAPTDYRCPMCGENMAIPVGITGSALPSEQTLICPKCRRSELIIVSVAQMQNYIYTAECGVKFVPPYYHISTKPTEIAEPKVTVSSETIYKSDK